MLGKENIVNFKDLSSGEKEKYFEFLSKNNILFEQGENKFVAKIKVKPDI